MFPSVPVLTVSELNRHVRILLEQNMGLVGIEGEISNLSKPSSGHYYFTLKDAGAQLRCVFFRNYHQRTDLQNGQHVQVLGTLSLYEARGDYQLIVEQLKEAGQGDLYRQFELLKIKLAALGLFEPTRKKPLPKFPHVIGIITSASAAALQDIITTLARRFPVAHLIIYPSEVQGKTAPQQLINAINRANEDNRCEVLILARGGGSIEDLWAFNDERLAHCICNSKLPIVSGIGHETDFTIADFVADFRAATPTAAAETLTPNIADLIAYIQKQQLVLIATMKRYLQHQQFLLKHALGKIESPKFQINTYWQKLDYIKLQLQQIPRKSIGLKRQRLEILMARLHAKNPCVLVQSARSRLEYLESTLLQFIQRATHRSQQQFRTLIATLHAVSPLATLDRGYAIVTHHHKVLFDSKIIQVGDCIEVRLAKGHLISTVTDKEES